MVDFTNEVKFQMVFLARCGVPGGCLEGPGTSTASKEGEGTFGSKRGPSGMTRQFGWLSGEVCRGGWSSNSDSVEESAGRDEVCAPRFLSLWRRWYSVFLTFAQRFFWGVCRALLRRLSSALCSRLLLRHIFWPFYRWLTGLMIRGASQYSSTLRPFPLTVLSHSIPVDRESRKKNYFSPLNSSQWQKKEQPIFQILLTSPAGFLSPSQQSLPLCGVHSPIALFWHPFSLLLSPSAFPSIVHTFLDLCPSRVVLVE